LATDHLSIAARRTLAVKINFERRGAGEPLLLLHGIGGELCVWEPVLEPLAERMDVIAVDLPGFGNSPPLADGVAPTPFALADAIAGLLDDLGIRRAHLAGNSLGGWVAMELGKTGRALSVTALCPAGLWGAPLRPTGAPARGGAQRLARRLRPVLPLLLLSRRARRLALGHVVADPDRVPYAAARRMVGSYARATAYDATDVAMREHHFTDPERIRVPLTVAFGQFDRLVRPRRVRVPNARTTILEGCSHIPMWDAPELVTQLILDTTGAAARTRRSSAAVS
jgi:pimeloyl-ACP methyl ester carboxylesterase